MAPLSVRPVATSDFESTLDGTLGAAFLGHFVTTVLYGITTLQAFIYFRDRHKDSTLTKLSVAGLWLLDSVHVGLITGAVYWYCVKNFLNFSAVQRPIWPIPMMIVVSNISNAIVRGFFGIRLYRLSNRSWILPGIIFVCSLFILIDAVYFSTRLWNFGAYEEINTISWGLYSGLSTEAAVDLIVAISQCILLRKFETGIRSTDSAIHVLMTYSVNTGLLTSFCAIGALVSYAVVPDLFIYFAFYFILSKLYVNSLLATLNARGSLLGKDARRQRHAKFRTPTATADPHGNTYDPNLGHGIEFTTVISASPFATDSIVETTKTKIDELSSSYSGNT